MNLQKQKAFTLVELIVVITILAILSTIGFVSYSSYLAWTRDANRISQLKAISEWLKLYSTNHSLPTPDATSTSIMDWLTQIATQWYAWKNVLETITYSTEWVDPKDKTYFSYYLTKDKKYFQLMAFLEEEDNLQNQALWVDYSKRYPTVFWDKLWILTTIDNLPIQESTWSIDISDVWITELKSFLRDWEYVSWSWAILSLLKDIADVWGRGYCIEANSFNWRDLDNTSNLKDSIYWNVTFSIANSVYDDDGTYALDQYSNIIPCWWNEKQDIDKNWNYFSWYNIIRTTPESDYMDVTKWNIDIYSHHFNIWTDRADFIIKFYDSNKKYLWKFEYMKLDSSWSTTTGMSMKLYDSLNLLLYTFPQIDFSWTVYWEWSLNSTLDFKDPNNLIFIPYYTSSNTWRFWVTRSYSFLHWLEKTKFIKAESTNLQSNYSVSGNANLYISWTNKLN